MVNVPHKPEGGTAPFWRTAAEHIAANTPPGGYAENAETAKEYWDQTHSLDGGLLAYLACNNGHELRCVRKHHTIAADGTLNPSWACTVPGCAWHEFAHLDGWTP